MNKIEQFIVELKSPATSAEERLLALKFLLHFGGDMHQPLHASDDHDAGGNQKNVTATGFVSGTLHHYWDSVFVESLGTDPFVVADKLVAKITKVQVSQWPKGTPTDWAKESFQAAKAHAYNLPAPNAHGPISAKHAVCCGRHEDRQHATEQGGSAARIDPERYLRSATSLSIAGREAARCRHRAEPESRH